MPRSMKICNLFLYIIYSTIHHVITVFFRLLKVWNIIISYNANNEIKHVI